MDSPETRPIIHAKDIWDNRRAIGYLQTLDFVDPEKIGMTGPSYGGHSTVFTAAQKAAVEWFQRWFAVRPKP